MTATISLTMNKHVTQEYNCIRTLIHYRNINKYNERALDLITIDQCQGTRNVYTVYRYTLVPTLYIYLYTQCTSGNFSAGTPGVCPFQRTKTALWSTPTIEGSSLHSIQQHDQEKVSTMRYNCKYTHTHTYTHLHTHKLGRTLFFIQRTRRCMGGNGHLRNLIRGYSRGHEHVRRGYDIYRLCRGAVTGHL